MTSIGLMEGLACYNRGGEGSPLCIPVDLVFVSLSSRPMDFSILPDMAVNGGKLSTVPVRDQICVEADFVVPLVSLCT